jgi:RraA family protein
VIETGLPTAALSDAARSRIALAARIRPVWPGARLAGRAFTVSTPAGQHLSVRRSLEEAEPGDVIVIDGEGSIERALWGDLMARRARDRGIAGVVIDGAVRDIEEIAALGFPVFAITSVPTGPLRELEGTVGQPISCGGLAVAPGDFVYGDADGVVIVPAPAHQATLERAREILAEELAELARES